jgi:hypothetical protein
MNGKDADTEKSDVDEAQDWINALLDQGCELTKALSWIAVVL